MTQIVVNVRRSETLVHLPIPPPAPPARLIISPPPGEDPGGEKWGTTRTPISVTEQAFSSASDGELEHNTER